MSIKIDDAYLYEHMPKVERELMDRIPPEEELDHKFSRRFERKMKKLMKEERRTPKERKVYRGMKLAFAAIAVVALIAFSSVMSVKAYRFRIIEFIVEVFTELTSYSVQEERPDGEEIVPIEPGYVPKGFEKTKCVEDGSGYFIWYTNNNGEKIHYAQTVAGAIGRFWDTEISVTNEVVIGKQKASLIEENGLRTLYWNDSEYVYSIAAPGEIELNELIKMARIIIKSRR